MERCAPGHHGFQRACDLISGQASTGPSGSPVFACAGKTEPPSRLILSQTSAGSCFFTRSQSGGLRRARFEGSTTSKNAPRDTCELVGKCDRKDVVMQPLLGSLDPTPEPIAPPGGLHLHKRDPRRLH